MRAITDKLRFPAGPISLPNGETVSGLVTPNGVGLSADARMLFVAETKVVASFNRSGVWTLSTDGLERRFASIDDDYVASGGPEMRTLYPTPNRAPSTDSA